MPKNLKAEFDRLGAIDPRLAELEAQIKAHARKNRSKPNYCANSHWYGYQSGFKGFKRTLCTYRSNRPDFRCCLVDV